MTRLELKCLELRRISLSISKTMKKLIGLLGAAGLLIPSAAMAGSIGNVTGTDASRVSAASYTTQNVTVDSNIFRRSDMHVEGTSSGNTSSFSAEDYVTGGGALVYTEVDVTAQTAADLDIDHLEIEGDWDIYVKDTEHTNNFSRKTTEEDGGSKKGHGKSRSSCKSSKCGGSKGGGSETETVKRSRHNSRDVLDTHGDFEGEADGSASYVASLDTQTSLTEIVGGASLKNGSFSESYDEYTGEYDGDLFEKGRTKTHVDADTDSVATSNGFESGHFNTTEWN